MRRFHKYCSGCMAAVVVPVVMSLLLVSHATAAAPSRPVQSAQLQGGEVHRLLGKAVPDECFAGIGQPYPPGPPCTEGKPKVNQGYVWGLTKAGDALWFGTGPNVNCLAIGQFFPVEPEPHQNKDWVCEFGASQLARNLRLPPALGDWRPPDVFVYNVAAGQLTEKTRDIERASMVDAQRLASTVGMRAAGSHGGVALFGGPSLLGGINLFAFDTGTGAYLGSTSLAAYNNIRKFVVANDALYAGVGVSSGGGGVLRWVGDRSEPFTFESVAALPTEAAELAEHDHRLFVTTWPTSEQAGTVPGRDRLAGLWMSPPLANGEPGLTESDAAAWTQVWSASDYEPDPIVARTYGGGALTSYGGRLYWGTMHVPFLATAAHFQAHPPTDPAQTLAAIAGTQRAISIFRGDGFGGGQPRIELLYGEKALPAFNSPPSGGVGAWQLEPTGYTPLYGPSGFGNPFNNYTWTMAVTNDKLFVGTMDWSYVATNAATPLQKLGPEGREPPGLKTALAAVLGAKRNIAVFGADLWAFPTPTQRAEPKDLTGVGNYLNYGLRTMVSGDDQLYLGTANPMNLRTDLTDRVPEGGWELVEFRAA